MHTPIKQPVGDQVLDVDNRTYSALLRDLRCLDADLPVGALLEAVEPQIDADRLAVAAIAGGEGIHKGPVGGQPDAVTDLPRTVTTGCGLRMPYAMTSPRPDSVTCLACREYVHRAY